MANFPDSFDEKKARCGFGTDDPCPFIDSHECSADQVGLSGSKFTAIIRIAKTSRKRDCELFKNAIGDV